MTTDNKDKDKPTAPAQNAQGDKPAPMDKTDLQSQQRQGQPVQGEREVDPSAGGGDEVTDKMNEDLEKGYHGSTPEETPNENFSVRGVTSGAKRPDAQDEPLSPGERGDK